MAISGGGLFLVLPIALLSGTASIALPCYRYLLPCFGVNMTPLWILLGIIGILGILLGFLPLKVGPRPGSGVALGLTFLLGLMGFVFWTMTSIILNNLIITPAVFLLFPETSVVLMASATGLFSLELLRRRRDAPAAMTS